MQRESYKQIRSRYERQLRKNITLLSAYHETTLNVKSKLKIHSAEKPYSSDQYFKAFENNLFILVKLAECVPFSRKFQSNFCLTRIFILFKVFQIINMVNRSGLKRI